MLIFLIGTRAQLIKVAPVMRALEVERIPYRLVFSGQHHETMEALLEDFAIEARPTYLYRGPEVTGVVQMGVWLLRCLWIGLSGRRRFFPVEEGAASAMVVHGDTFSTLLGALIGRVLGIDVVHLEAGLRSGNLFHPFPEEATRRIVFRLARVAICPGAWACANMANYSAEVVDSGENTLRDALRLVTEGEGAAAGGEAYGVVSLHRFENIFVGERLEWLVERVEEAAARMPLVFVLHPATRKQLTKFGLMGRLEANERIRLAARMRYSRFVRLLRSSRFVITDGGSNQEELSYLGIPTLIMRKATERNEGIGGVAVLCGYDAEVMRSFLDGLGEAPPRPLPAAGRSPSAIVVDRLRRYAGPGGQAEHRA